MPPVVTTFFEVLELPAAHTWNTRVKLLSFPAPCFKVESRVLPTLGKEFWGVHTSLFKDIKQYLKKKSSDFKFLSGPLSLKNINIKRGCHHSLVSMIVNLEYL